MRFERLICEGFVRFNVNPALYFDLQQENGTCIALIVVNGSLPVESRLAAFQDHSQGVCAHV